MSKPIKILIVEDEITNSILMKRILVKEKYLVVTAFDGLEALKILEKETFDAVLTDWMMPKLDGIELIKQMRANISPLPLIIMITALVSDGAKSHALDSGADDYIAKPINVKDLLRTVKLGLEKKNQAPVAITRSKPKKISKNEPPFVGVFLAISTGGPPTLIELFKSMDKSYNVAYFIVQHGPAWMLDTFSQRLAKETGFVVNLAHNDMPIEAGNIYLAPGDVHIKIDPQTYNILLDDGPKENFVRPAADPLFRSAAESFGDKSVAIVLTGLGKDGSQGISLLNSVGGKIIIQDPATAVASAMPNSAISMNVSYTISSINNINKTLKNKLAEINYKQIK